jgi:hypothetical protein
MPLFYFDLVDGVRERDLCGQQLAGLAEARVEAVAFACEQLRASPALLMAHGEFWIDVRSETGKDVFHVAIRAVEPSDFSRSSNRTRW